MPLARNRLSQIKPKVPSPKNHMPHPISLAELLGRLDEWSISRLTISAREAQTLERKNEAQMEEAIAKGVPASVRALQSDAEPTAPDFERILADQWFRTQRKAMDLAEKERELRTRPNPGRPARMAKLPSSLAELKRLYDLWRKGKWTPPGAKKNGKALEREYKRRVRSAFNDANDQWKRGEISHQDMVDRVAKEAKVTESRASTIVRTETTNAYNDARRRYYDASPDVTHYLFVAIRDKRTTAWCKSRNGVVFKKGTKLCDDNQPACHWNCRSEYLPLTPQNIAHAAFIDDPKLQASNRTLEPLPKDWKRK